MVGEKEKLAVAPEKEAPSRGEGLKHEKARYNMGEKDVKRPFEEGEMIKLGDIVARLEVEKQKLVVVLQEEAPSRGVELKHEKAP